MAPVQLLNQGARASDESNQPLFETFVPLTRGVNNIMAARWLPENACVSMENGTLDDPGSPAKREGYTPIGSQPKDDTDIISDGFATTRIGGFGFLNPSTGSKVYLIGFGGGSGKCYFCTDLGSGGWTEAQTAAPASLALDVGTDDDAESAKMFQGRDLLWILPGGVDGSGSVNIHAMNNAGVLYDAGNSGDNVGKAPRNIVDGCYFLNRIWLLRQKAGNPELHWSKALPASGDFSVTGASSLFNTDNSSSPTANSDAGMLEVSPSVGSKPIAIVPWNQRTLILFFESSIEAIDVATSGTIYANSTRNVLEHRIGCASRDSIVQIGNEVYFLDNHGEYRSLQQTELGDKQGVVVEPISEPVRNEFPGRMGNQVWKQTKATLYKNRIMLFYCRDNDLQSQDGFVYRPGRVSWEGKHRYGAPVGVIMLAENALRGGSARPFEMYTTNGDTSTPTATIYRWFDGGYSDGGATPIAFNMRTRGFTFGMPENQKIPYFAEMDVHGDAGASADLYLVTDAVQGAWQLSSGQPQLIASAGITAGADSNFPLYDLPGVTKTTDESGLDVFPLVAGDFPLYDPDEKVHRVREPLQAGFSEGREMQLEIREATNETRFRVVNYYLAAQPHYVDEEIGT